MGQAVRLLRQALEIAPGNANLWMYLSVLLGQSDQVEAAIRACEEVLKIRPDMAEAYLHLGRLQLQRGDRERAELEFARALRFDPELQKDVESFLQEW